MSSRTVAVFSPETLARDRLISCALPSARLRIADFGFTRTPANFNPQSAIRNRESAIKKPVRPLSDGLSWKGKTRKPESQIWGQSRVQLKRPTNDESDMECGDLSP